MHKIKINDQLEIHYRKQAIYFMTVTPFTPQPDHRKSSQHFKFTKSDFEDFLENFIQACEFAWKDFSPTEANSLMSDYFEYYSKEFDNNGYLSIRENTIILDPPYGSTQELYKFNKAKARTFVYDLAKQIQPEGMI